MTRQASTDHPVHELIAKRWSPYGFSGRPVSDADLRSIFEAARWAPSSYNEQPWSFIVATRDDKREFERMLSCLVPPNREWAQAAPVLALSVARLSFARNGKPNRVAVHDMGLAAADLTLEAAARGLSVHQMAGILPDVARETYAIPEGHEPVTGIAVGYAADPQSLPEAFQERDLAPRTRKPLADFVYSGRWGGTSKLVG